MNLGLVRSKGAATPQNRMRCAAIKSLKVQHAQYFATDFGISQPFINGFQHCDGDLISCHVICA